VGVGGDDYSVLDLQGHIAHLAETRFDFLASSRLKKMKQRENESENSKKKKAEKADEKAEIDASSKEQHANPKELQQTSGTSAPSPPSLISVAVAAPSAQKEGCEYSQQAGHASGGGGAW
jgi:hypothetical protein